MGIKLGSFSQALFQSKHLTLKFKQVVYFYVILPTLLCGAETWNVKAPALWCVTALLNQCIHIILGVSKFCQWTEQIHSAEFASCFGMMESVQDMLVAHQLRWLGHLASSQTTLVCMGNLSSLDHSMVHVN